MPTLRHQRAGSATGAAAWHRHGAAGGQICGQDENGEDPAKTTTWGEHITDDEYHGS